MSKVKLAISVMTHPSRMEKYTEPLLESLRAELEQKEELRSSIAISVKMDAESRGIWWNAKQCWKGYRKYGDWATHQMVLQDDVVVCADFLEGVMNAIEACPRGILQFFSMNRKFAEQALEAGKHWIEINDIVSAQCIVMPPVFAEEWLVWCALNIPEDFKHDDSRLGMWIQEKGYKSYIAVPNLLDHAGASDSLVGQSDRRRVARVWMGHVDYSVLDIDWTIGPDKIFKAPKQPFSPAYKNYLERMNLHVEQEFRRYDQGE